MKGEYFCWLSHDDLYFPDCVKEQVEALSRLDNKKTITRTELNTMNELYEITWPDTRYRDHMDAWPPRKKSAIYPVIYMKLHGCQLMFHRSCFDEVGLFDEKALVAQDYEFFARAFQKFPSVLIPKVLGTSRDSSNRQGRRSQARGAIEYSQLFLGLIESFDDDDFKLLAPSKLQFLKDMQEIYKYAGYDLAYEEISKKLLPHIHVNYTDIHGRRFNGYDLHLEARNDGKDAHQIVWEKTSDTHSVIELKSMHGNAEIYDSVSRTEAAFGLRSQLSPFMYDILHHPAFLNSQVVHYHIMHHPAFNINMIPVLTSLKPSVWTIHDPWILSGHCVHHASCEKWKTHCQDCEYLDAMMAIDYDNTALQFEIKRRAIEASSAHFVVASRWMEEKLSNSPMMKGKKITRIPFGVDQNFFSPGNVKEARENLNITDGGFVMFARAEAQFKGLTYIQEVLSKIPDDRKVTLITVGETGHFEQFRRSNVNILDMGWVHDPEVLRDCYRACDLFLMPSEKESFGMMAIEAMSCAKLVVALDHSDSALPSVINSPDVGLAFKPAHYSNAILSLMSSPTETASRGQLSREFAAQEYSHKVYYQRIMELYDRVVREFVPSARNPLILDQLRKHSDAYRSTVRYIPPTVIPVRVEVESPVEIISPVPVFQPRTAFDYIRQAKYEYVSYGLTHAVMKSLRVSKRIARNRLLPRRR